MDSSYQTIVDPADLDFALERLPTRTSVATSNPKQP